MSNYFKILIISLFLNFLIWLLLFFGLKQNSEPIILHYSAYLGADLIGFWPDSFSLPAVGFIIIILNYFLAWYLPKKRLQYLLVNASLICQVFLLIASISIVIINA
ncbi:MAG: hypothetical protein ABIG90_02280 [bacterium]